MIIPEKIKIGGQTYKVDITENLFLGAADYSGEIDYKNLTIKILPLAKEKMEVIFLHEMLHGIFEFLGYIEHDEKKIDELAHALHMVIKDNPEMFGAEGEGDKE